MGSKSVNKYQYRADIDGLRAIAVLFVILYHLWPGTFLNGFLGVDIFFVISGFVVTQTIEKNASPDYFRTLINFYGRRIKRILPALYFTVLITFLAACFFVPSTELRSIFKTALSAVFGISNLSLLYVRFDYFSPDLVLNPFVHTWSLGVEEQFYLLFPTIFIALTFINSYYKWINTKYVLVIIALCSLLYWIYMQYEAPLVAFYNPLSRFWELLTGVILFLNKDKIAASINKLSFIYYVLIAGMFLAIFVELPNFKIPYYFANIFAVLGTASIIITGINNGGKNIVLSNRPIVFIGKISYSLYLWHYSVFAFMHWNADLDSAVNVALALMLTFLFAYFSYSYIEKPFRYFKAEGKKVLFAGLLTGVSVAAIIVFLYFLPPSRIYLGNTAQYSQLWLGDNSPMTPSLNISQRSCHLQYLDTLSPDLCDKCSTRKGYQNKIFLFGNSHAQHLIPILEIVSNKLNYDYSTVTISNARMMDADQIMSAINYKFDLARIYFQTMSKYILLNGKKGDIVLFGNKSLFEKPDESQKSILSNIYIGDKKLTNEEAYQHSIKDITALSDKLDSIGVKVIFVGPTPTFKLEAAQVAPEWFRTKKTDVNIPRDSVLKSGLAYTVAVSEVLSKTKNTYSWDPLVALCDQYNCNQILNGKLLYRDKHHLSLYGAELLAPDFIRFLKVVHEK